MKEEMKVLMLVGLLITAFSFSIPVGVLAAKPVKPIDWLAEIADNIDNEYAQMVTEDIVAIRSSELGFRATGTPAEYETVDYILDEMNQMGMVNVATEEVPVHAWEFKSASLTIEPNEMEIMASSFGGVQGTNGPITGELVYVGSSYSSDYEGLDVSGKIVLSNWDGENIWIDALGKMAYDRGAIGVVASCMDSVYGQGPYALQTHDSNWNTQDWPPMIYIPKEYGFMLVGMLEEGDVTVTMESDINLDLNGIGLNTIGYIPGKNFGTEDDELIIIGDHHDGWFEAAGDDVSGTAATLAMAKAIIDAGYEPERTLVFTTHTAEEYGTTNVYYDWCVGAWYQITREHTEWPGKAIAYLNLETQAQKGSVFGVDTPVDLFPFINKIVKQNQNKMPYGATVYGQISTWNDGWTFTAAGVPGITTATWAMGGELAESNIYHTQLDNLATLDFEYMVQCIFMNLAIAIGLDQEPIIPYNFAARAGDFFGTWNKGEVASTGVDGALVNSVDQAAREFSRLATKWQNVKRSIAEDDVDVVNKVLLEINKIIEDEFTAMGVWEDSLYPHEQPLMDSIWTQVAIDDLKDGYPGSVLSAERHLKWWVGTVWYYDYVDYEYYWEDAVAMHSPDNWGEQVQLGEIVDTWDVIVSLDEKLASGNLEFGAERAMLLEEKQVALENLGDALNTLLRGFTQANALLKQIT